MEVVASPGLIAGGEMMTQVSVRTSVGPAATLLAGAL